MIAKTPDTPYYAVIFTTLRTSIDEGYLETAKQMEDLAKLQNKIESITKGSADASRSGEKIKNELEKIEHELKEINKKS